MRRTFTEKAAARQNGLAVGHQLWFSLPIPVPDLPVPVGSLPSGQLISIAEDMGHYLIAQLNAGAYADRQVLSAQGMAQMHQAEAKVSIAGNEMSSYGLGWFINQTGLGPLIFHDGEVPDFFSYMALMPDQDRAMILLVNANEQVYNYALWNLSENAALKLMDLPVPGNCWGILPWAMRATLILPILQVAAICISMQRFTRWQKDPAHRPGVLRLWLMHILLPTLINLLLIGSAAAILFSGMLPFIMLFMGDIAALLLLMGAIALVWLGVRSAVILKVWRLSQP